MHRAADVTSHPSHGPTTPRRPWSVRRPPHPGAGPRRRAARAPATLIGLAVLLAALVTSTGSTATLQAAPGSPGDPLAVLERLDAAARLNARIDLDIPAGADPVTDRQLAQAEQLWNDGQHAPSLALLHSLRLQGVEVVVGVSWLDPVPMDSSAKAAWFIGHGTYNATLVAGGDSSWVLVQYQENNLYYAAVYRSNALPYPWSQIYVFYSSSQLRFCSAAIMGDYLYIAYGGSGAFNGQVRVRRLSRVTDGYDILFGDRELCNTGDPEVGFTELKLIDDKAGPWPIRLFCVALQSDAVCKLYQSSNGWSWSLLEDWGLVSHTLDATFPDSENAVLVSYVSTTFDRIVVARYDIGDGSFHMFLLTAYDTGSVRISSYGPRVAVVYERHDPTLGKNGIAYSLSSDLGEHWTSGNLIMPTASVNLRYFCPDVAVKAWSTAVVYKREEAPKTDAKADFKGPYWFAVRNMATTSTWSDPVPLSDLASSWTIQSEVVRRSDHGGWHTVLFDGLNQFIAYTEIPLIFRDDLEYGHLGSWSALSP